MFMKFMTQQSSDSCRPASVIRLSLAAGKERIRSIFERFDVRFFELCEKFRRETCEAVNALASIGADSPAGITPAVMPPLISAIGEADAEHRLDENHAVLSGKFCKSLRVGWCGMKPLEGRTDINRIAILIEQPDIDCRACAMPRGSLLVGWSHPAANRSSQASAIPFREGFDGRLPHEIVDALLPLDGAPSLNQSEVHVLWQKLDRIVHHFCHMPPYVRDHLWPGQSDFRRDGSNVDERFSVVAFSDLIERTNRFGLAFAPIPLP